MLRVLTLSTLYPHAADPTFGVFVEGQTRRLAAQPGVDLQVVSPIAWPPFPLNVHPRYRRLRGVPQREVWNDLVVWRPRFTVIPGLSGALNPFSLVRSVRSVITQMHAAGFRPDVIDAEFFYPDGPAAAHVAKNFRIPLSIKARGADIHYWAARAACRRLILKAAHQANGLLAVSQSLKQDMIALGIAADKVSVHYTGVDLDLFQPSNRAAAKAALGVSGKLVVSLGALIPRKGHDIVIEALATLPDVILLIVGDGPSRPALTRLVSARGLQQRVRFLGRIPHAQLPPILAAADVMALASESEGLANAWVEAVACGTPVVAPAIDGAAETICPPNGGRLITQRTGPAMAAALHEVLANPPDQQRVREQAMRFAWQRNTEALYAHLSGLAEQAKRASN